MERLVLDFKLSPFINEHELISEEQGGFRIGRGTIESLFNILSARSYAYDKNVPFMVTFLDLKKAYDKVFRDGLLKLFWNMGIRGRLWRVIREMYNKTVTAVKMESNVTKFFDSVLGILQGSVLGPTLFNLLINDIITKTKK